MSTRYQQLICVSVTLTSANQAYSLSALVLAQLTQANDQATAPTIARELGIQLHPGSAGTLYVGDQYVSATRAGYVLTASGTDRERACSLQLPVNEVWLMADNPSIRVNVLILQ